MIIHLNKSAIKFCLLCFRLGYSFTKTNKRIKTKTQARHILTQTIFAGEMLLLITLNILISLKDVGWWRRKISSVGTSHYYILCRIQVHNTDTLWNLTFISVHSHVWLISWSMYFRATANRCDLEWLMFFIHSYIAVFLVNTFDSLYTISIT